MDVLPHRFGGGAITHESAGRNSQADTLNAGVIKYGPGVQRSHLLV